MAQEPIDAAAAKQKRLRGYVMMHLAETCKFFTGIEDDLFTTNVHPQLYPLGAEVVEKLTMQREQLVAHIEQVIQDLKSTNGQQQNNSLDTDALKRLGIQIEQFSARIKQAIENSK
jgi:cobalamin biosynthesis protein CobD/CbiB